MFSTGRARYLMLFNESSHLFLAPCIYAFFQCASFFCTEIFDDLICTETLMAFFTVHQRIRESTQMTGSYPCLRIHQDCTVHTYIVRIFLDELFPPCSFYIVLQFHTKITIIPGVCQAAVYFGTRIYESSGFGKCNDFFHCFFHN